RNRDRLPSGRSDCRGDVRDLRIHSSRRSRPVRAPGVEVYVLLRAIAGIALRWYYRDIHVEGLDRIPRRRPLLLVVNHPNALVDALLVGWASPRRVLITAKSTIFSNPIAGALLLFVGVLPLYRAKDQTPGERADPT